MIDLFNYERRKTSVTHVGNLDIGLSLIHISEPTRPY